MDKPNGICQNAMPISKSASWELWSDIVKNLIRVLWTVCLLIVMVLHINLDTDFFHMGFIHTFHDFWQFHCTCNFDTIIKGHLASNCWIFFLRFFHLGHFKFTQCFTKGFTDCSFQWIWHSLILVHLITSMSCHLFYEFFWTACLI